MNRQIKQFGFYVALNLATISILTIRAVLAIIKYNDWWTVLNHHYTVMRSACKGSKSRYESSSDDYNGDSTHDNARRIRETKGVVANYNTALTPCELYDTNGTPGIQKDEALNAVTDYFDDVIDIDTVLAVIVCYFA